MKCASETIQNSKNMAKFEAFRWHISSSIKYKQGRQSGLKSGGAQRGGAENFGVYENHFSPNSTVNDRT